ATSVGSIMSSLLADVSLDGLSLNGHLFQSPVPPAEYEAALGAAARVEEPTTPAPYGHRNNQIHLFDRLGGCLIEHHPTRLVTAAVFVLWLEEAAFRPEGEFAGALRVGGMRCSAGMEERDLSGCTIPLVGPTLGLWSACRDGIWVGI